MKVLLVQVDGKMPNLALMKISAYHKYNGHEVGWAFANPDKVYVSCVFSQNLPHAKGISQFYPDAEFHIGGPGLGYPNSLPDSKEERMPDYSIYPDLDYSMGFTTRGCIRKCAFCVVPIIEGKFRIHQHPKIFCHPNFKKVVLLDNNILASGCFEDDMKWIQDQGLKVCFNQGLDARLVTEDIANTLANMKSYNLHFNNRTYYFAWDLIENEEQVLQGLNLMIDVGIHPRSLMVYVLVGFNTTHEQDYYRFQELRKRGTDPFIMIYNNRKDDLWIRHFARWVNKRIYKSCALEDYDRYDLTPPPKRREK